MIYFKDSDFELNKIINTLLITQEECKKSRNDTILNGFLDLIKTEELKEFGKQLMNCELERQSNSIMFDESANILSQNIKQHYEVIGTKNVELGLLVSKIDYLKYSKKEIELLLKYFEEMLIETNQSMSKNAENLKKMKELDMEMMKNQLNSAKNYLDSEKNRLNKYFNDSKTNMNNKLTEVSKAFYNEKSSFTYERTTTYEAYYLFWPITKTVTTSYSVENSNKRRLEIRMKEDEYELQRIVSRQHESLTNIQKEYEISVQNISLDSQKKSTFDKINAETVQAGEMKFTEELERKRQEKLMESKNFEKEISTLLEKQIILKKEVDLEEGLVNNLLASREEKTKILEKENCVLKERINNLKSEINKKLKETGHANDQVALNFAAAIAKFIHDSSYFSMSIQAFLQFCISYKSVMNFEAGYLKEALEIDVEFIEEYFNDSFIEEWAISSFPKNQEFHKVITEKFDLKKLVELFKSEDDNFIKSTLFLKPLQLKSAKMGINSFIKRNKCLFLKNYVSLLLEKLNRIVSFE